MRLMCKKYLAYYLRLSQDDNNIGESNSIVSQREIIKEYIYSSNEFIEAQTLEFVDDGYSGTNFNRPGIQKLFEAVKNGEIECIIVKDLSRFGRQYLEVNKYIEQIFPYIGVRFIAITDNYDSNNHKGTTAEIDVPVRNMINAMYSMDISKKIKSAKQAKIKQGIFASGFAIYGYKKDKVNKNQLLIDEPAAAVVRQIFQLALDGNSTFQIAKKLNSERISSPAIHKNISGSKKKWNARNEEHNFWTCESVYRIIKDERYIGTFIGGKKESGRLGSNESIFKPKEEWVRIPDSHPAIISQEQFDIVNGMMKKKSGNKGKKIPNIPLYKKVWCGKCGRRLRYRNRKHIPFYFCYSATYSDKYGCMSDKMREKDLNEAVLIIVLTQIKLFINNEKLLRMAENKINKPNITADNSILQLDNEVKTLQTNKRKLYERYKNNEINQILYLQEREILEKELINKAKERESFISQKQSYNYTSILESTQQISRRFLKYQEITELTSEMVDEFIEKITVYDCDRIEIKFTFQDEMEKLINSLNGGN